MKYKGYIGHFIYDEDLDLFEGQVTNVTDIVHFHGKSIESLHFAFQDAVNEYISWCKKMGREPEKPSSLLWNIDPGFKHLLNHILGAFRDVSAAE